MHRTRSSLAGILALLVVTGLGCSDSSSRNITGPSPTAIQLDRSGGVEKQIVTGDAEFMLPEGPGVLTKTSYEMSAVRDRDGRFKGEVEIRVDRDPRQFFHAEIACFLVVGNTAHLAAVVKKSSVSFVHPGDYLAWSVVDTGEGKRSVRDQTSNFFLVDEHVAQNHCMNGGLNAPLFPVEHGNIQVHASHDD